MSSSRWAAVDAYLEGALITPDEALTGALRRADAAGLPPIQVSPSQGKLLQILAQAIGARSILEIGTLGAYSTIWLARALPANGSLVTIEAEPKHADVALASIAAANYSDRVEVRVGRALDVLPVLADEIRSGSRGPFDFVFIDADKINNRAYFDWSVRLARPGALIITDNVVRDGHVVDADSTDPSVIGTRALFDGFRTEARTVTSALQTVGNKGYDGFAISLVLPA